MNSTPIRAAGPDEAAAVGALLEAAFQEPVAFWLAPDPATRRSVLTEFFTLVAEDAFKAGSVEVAGDYAGVAVWFDLTGTETGPQAQEPPEADDRYARVYGPHAHRWTTFEELTGGRHPEGTPHHYLLLVGIRPDLQNRGLGRALIEHHHEWVSPGLPTYLEATTLDSRRLYQRLGYRDHGEPLQLPDGPTVYPMWRSVG